MGWAPAVDGPGGSLPAEPLRLFAAGGLNPGIDGFSAGTNSDEGSMFTLVRILRHASSTRPPHIGQVFFAPNPDP